MPKEKICDEYANGIKRVLCWTFASILNHYFDDGTVILVEADSDGKDIEFSATHKWLELNHAREFGITKEMADTFLIHIESCQSPQCIEAKRMLDLIGPIFKEGLPAGVAIVSALQLKSRGVQTRLTKKNGFDDAIDELLPIFKLFTGENKNFWIWPEYTKTIAKEVS